MTQCDVLGQVDMLPDDVLLTIFDSYVDKHMFGRGWQTLVHVCRQWRSVVFGSPRRLNLGLFCGAGTPGRDTLDVWPAFPLVIDCRFLSDLRIEMEDIMVAVLERSDRVHKICLGGMSGSALEKVSAAMQVPFPELTDLQLWLHRDEIHETVPVLPDSLLGGSAPRLRQLELYDIPFPGLPKLLLSATHLVDLDLIDIPDSGYFSPGAMVTALPALTNLWRLRLEFRSPRSHPDPASRSPPPLIPFVFPVLTHVSFTGVCEYLDDLVAHIDAPRLGNLGINFFNQNVFNTPHLAQFISRTPKLKLPKEVHLTFDAEHAAVQFQPGTGGEYLYVGIQCREYDRQVSSVEQVCTSCLRLLSALENLYIYEGYSAEPEWGDNIENMRWLELLHPFPGVKNLYLSNEVARCIGTALQELVGGTATEVLPTLEYIFLKGLEPPRRVREGIDQFVATRQVTGHPIADCRIGWYYWDRR